MEGHQLTLCLAVLSIFLAINLKSVFAAQPPLLIRHRLRVIEGKFCLSVENVTFNHSETSSSILSKDLKRLESAGFRSAASARQPKAVGSEFYYGGCAGVSSSCSVALDLERKCNRDTNMYFSYAGEAHGLKNLNFYVDNQVTNTPTSTKASRDQDLMKFNGNLKRGSDTYFTFDKVEESKNQAVRAYDITVTVEVLCCWEPEVDIKVPPQEPGVGGPPPTKVPPQGPGVGGSPPTKVPPQGPGVGGSPPTKIPPQGPGVGGSPPTKVPPQGPGVGGSPPAGLVPSKKPSKPDVPVKDASKVTTPAEECVNERKIEFAYFEKSLDYRTNIPSIDALAYRGCADENDISDCKIIAKMKQPCSTNNRLLQFDLKVSGLTKLKFVVDGKVEETISPVDGVVGPIQRTFRGQGTYLLIDKFVDNEARRIRPLYVTAVLKYCCLGDAETGAGAGGGINGGNHGGSGGSGDGGKAKQKDGNMSWIHPLLTLAVMQG